MLKGIEVGEQSGFKKAVLIQALKNEEAIEHLRMMITYKSNILDRTNQEDISNFNKLLNRYDALVNPFAKKKEESSIKTSDVKALSSLDMSKVKFKTGENPLSEEIRNLSASKEKEGIVKII